MAIHAKPSGPEKRMCVDGREAWMAWPWNYACLPSHTRLHVPRPRPPCRYLPRLPNHPSREDLLSWGVDGFEVVNGETFDLGTLQWASSKVCLVVF